MNEALAQDLKRLESQAFDRAALRRKLGELAA
jgi:hypothetical protein